MSIGLAIALVGLASLAVALLLVPLLRRSHQTPPRDAYNLAVYRDQLAEVERDLRRGLLNPPQAEAARAEIGRRILTLDAASEIGEIGRKPLIAAVIAVLLMPIAALALYARLGSPSVPDQPFAARRSADVAKNAGSTGQLGFDEALAKLRAHLQQRPDDLTGWLLLARSEFGLAHFAEAAEAYRRADELSGHRADISGDWGEAQVMAAGGTVTPEARKAFEAALQDEGTAPRSRYYLALTRLQQGDAKGALDDWVALEAASPHDAEWLPLVHRRIAEAAAAAGVPVPPAAHRREPPAAAKPADEGMPSQDAVAAARGAAAGASAEQRAAMIEGMVERLAARLEQHPDDADGWARLGRAYMVLNRPGKARDAYAHAAKLQPDDTALKQLLDEATTAARTPPHP